VGHGRVELQDRPEHHETGVIADTHLGGRTIRSDPTSCPYRASTNQGETRGAKTNSAT
jgi:hypothetical protein